MTERFTWNRWHLVILLYVGFIYCNSLTPSSISSQESGFILRSVKDMLGNLGWEHMWLTEHIVRKSAHFIEYAGLGCILVMAFRPWKAPFLIRLRTVCELAFIVPFVDETIQLFVPGRSGQVSDVWLDLWGAVCGMVLTGCIMAWRYQRKKYMLRKVR